MTLSVKVVRGFLIELLGSRAFRSNRQRLAARSTMKITDNPEVDTLSITFRDATVTTKHLAEGIAADYDVDGRLAGLEILDAIKRFGGQEALRQVIIEGLGPAQNC